MAGAVGRGMALRWNVIDSHTGHVVGSYASLQRARRAVDRLDNAYGGYRYHVVAATP